MDRSARYSSFPGAVRLGLVVLLLLSGCGAAVDVVAEPPTSAVETEALVRQLPEATASVMVIDAVMAAAALGADRDALGHRADLPAVSGADRPDPDGQLGNTLLAAITPLIAPSDNAHEVIDLGEITGVVQAITAEPRGALVTIATTQSSDELLAAYADAGFAPAGDDVLVLPGRSSPGDVSGGFPAVQVSDGLLILATTTDLLDRWDAATGPGDDVLSLLAAAGEHWAVSIQLPPMGAASCGEGAAIVSDGATDLLLLLDGGEDRLDRTAADQLSFQVGDARPDGEVTRYPITASDPTPAALIIGSVLADSVPLTSC